MVNIFEKILKERVEEVSKNIGKKIPIYNKDNTITGYAPYPHKDLFEDPIVENLLSARQFIIELYDEDDIFREYNTFQEYNDNPSSFDRFGLPFENCFFAPSKMKPFVKLNINSKYPFDIEMYGIHIREWTPDLVQVWSFGKITNGKNEKPYFSNFNYSFHHKTFDSIDATAGDKEMGQNVAREVMGAVHSILTTLQTSKTGVLKRGTKIKYRFKKRNYQHKINNIIYTGSKLESSHKLVNNVNQPVDWSHGWIVRGHWRRLKNTNVMGKDRHGERTVKGITWVVPYSKNDELGIVDKIRKFKVEKDV